MFRRSGMIVLSNRLPVRRVKREAKSVLERSSGGLVTARGTV